MAPTQGAVSGAPRNTSAARVTLRATRLPAPVALRVTDAGTLSNSRLGIDLRDEPLGTRYY